MTVQLPTNPGPNSSYDGHIHVNGSQDNFRYVFNEQVTNPDGSLTVYAAHEYLLGPTALGDLFIGKSQCGLTGIPAVPARKAVADFDGDHKTDLSVFRPSSSTWFVANSAGGDTARAFGTSGDVPVPGDYDGDGKSDIAVFRPSTGTWFVANSAGGDTARAFGTSGDVPVPLPAAIRTVVFP
ncbi:MAG: VCBS repeat-containing protein [Acidimicrobiales bacterium]